MLLEDLARQDKREGEKQKPINWSAEHHQLMMNMEHDIHMATNFN
jgi:hypothetical protein